MFDRLFGRLFGRSQDAQAAADLYARIVAQARRPEFYGVLGVPDTLDGRFDMVALHLFLVMHRLKGQGAAADARSRRLFEVVTNDFERTLREMGVGDQGIARRVTAMVGGARGRLTAYDAAIAQDDPALEVALDNNVYGTVPEPDPRAITALAGYVRRSVAELAAQPLDSLLSGAFHWAEPPAQKD
ncbi:ubiquinol-cytochrome C chaperone family protein [Azospirillum sp. TSO22-1]|uniref:ubiquinol-cytochrome C chaperone family protein n=1 Tax=Azospirillum sp. TSO22-1 TaxID=716789 RepID=UPI000D61BB39|nr:ubiquinol-cytochrome C chaperone family protein [Azospirillum sp. TSO22-1]PWC38375.1 ubiquinol-cytochrome C chaperone [Azospirillum sp. TSO22-1]